jgi:tRNA(Ile2)-agmatinylcytidine synthase
VTVIGIDDTDSREQGMCTTYVATRLAERLAAAGVAVERTLLVRLHPAIEHKTRGNAALAVHCDADPGTALEHVGDALDLAATEDDQTNPGAVVAGVAPDAVSGPVAAFAGRAVRERCSPAEARRRCEAAGFERLAQGNGRGVVGALAAVGAWQAFDSWTYECLSYRERERWGTDRQVDRDSVFRAAEAFYPEVFDTVDRVENTAVCVPRTPCPVLYGIRGETPDAVRAVADRIESEPVARRRVFVTNQGTDAHLQEASLSELADGGCYRVDATVVSPPETREGGHVFLTLGEGTGARNDSEEETTGDRIDAAAFEPTKRFRDRVRALRPGDRVTVCGEVSTGTLKLEKFAVRELVRTERVTPTCPDCGRSMSSAGRNAGYRCRDCGTAADGKVRRPVDRALERGWYEVPPCARRHVAKPLVRGGFDAPTHPER